MARYEAKLDLALNNVGDVSKTGQRLNDLFATCRFLPVERHGVSDRVITDAAEIVRFLQERADVARHLR